MKPLSLYFGTMPQPNKHNWEVTFSMYWSRKMCKQKIMNIVEVNWLKMKYQLFGFP